MQQSKESRQLSEEDLYFYEDTLCAEADFVFRFNLALHFNRVEAVRRTNAVFLNATQQLAFLRKLDEASIRQWLMQQCFLLPGRVKEEKKDIPEGLGNLEKEERACVFGRDIAGLSFKQLASVIESSEEDAREALKKGRAALHQHFIEPLVHPTDRGLYALAADVEGGAEAESAALDAAGLLASETNQQAFQQIKEAIGHLQVEVAESFLNEEETLAVHSLIEDRDVRMTREAERIEEVGRWEAMGDFRRRMAFLAIVAGLIASIVYFFKPAGKPSFDALEALEYEAIAMTEAALAAKSEASSRLDLPTNSFSEVASFVELHKGLDFNPVLVENLPPEWRPEGVSIIDYEAAKIIAVQFRRQGKGSEGRPDRVFYFNFAGKLTDFPPTEVGKLNDDFKYFTYGTDVHNIVVWQPMDGVVSMLIGHLSALELAELAKGTL